MRTPAEAAQYLGEAEFMLRHQFDALAHYDRALDDIQEALRKMEETKDVLSSVFIERDQWSPAANYHHGRFVERMEQLRAREADLRGGGAVAALLARVGATIESLDLVAGTILQVGKQALSYRFGPKGSVPRGVRVVGSQDVVEVVWEGRNHAMHWEEGMRPGLPSTTMLNALAADLGVAVVPHSNNSRVVLNALGWQAADDVLNELRQLVR